MAFVEAESFAHFYALETAALDDRRLHAVPGRRNS
jgi:hypothetical protein